MFYFVTSLLKRRKLVINRMFNVPSMQSSKIWTVPNLAARCWGPSSVYGMQPSIMLKIYRIEYDVQSANYKRGNLHGFFTLHLSPPSAPRMRLRPKVRMIRMPGLSLDEGCFRNISAHT